VKFVANSEVYPRPVLKLAADDEIGQVQEGGAVFGRREGLQGLFRFPDVIAGDLEGAFNGRGGRDGPDRFLHRRVG